MMMVMMMVLMLVMMKCKMLSQHFHESVRKMSAKYEKETKRSRFQLSSVRVNCSNKHPCLHYFPTIRTECQYQQYPHYLCCTLINLIDMKVQLCDPDLLPRADPHLQVPAEGEARRHPQPEDPLWDGPRKAWICLLPGKHHLDNHNDCHHNHFRWQWCKTSWQRWGPNCWRPAMRRRSWWSRLNKTQFRWKK